MKAIIIKDGDNEATVEIAQHIEIAQHNPEEVRLSPSHAVKIGYLLVRRAREVCQHQRCNRHYDSDGPHNICLVCGTELG